MEQDAGLKQRRKAGPTSGATSHLNRKTPTRDTDETQSIGSFLSSHIFLVILTVRTLSVCFNLIWDCDEVYNYWEPLHFVLFGNGLKTWEYSPAYSLRSYLYIYLHALPLWAFKWIVSSKMTLFYMLRFVLAFVSSKAEAFLYKSLLAATSRSKLFSQLAPIYLFLSLTSAGMFLSVTSFLPSTCSMYLCMIAYAAWLNKPTSRLAIFAVGLAILLCWPFVLILGLPIAVDMCLLQTRRGSAVKDIVRFIGWACLFACVILAPMVGFDSYMFGKIVVAPLNIFMYNVFPADPSQGPDLYGREPLSFYIFNCLLNFNCLCPLVLIGALLLFVANPSPNKQLRLISFGLFMWLLVFFTRPHKEERFLYPVYPFILIMASVALSYARFYLTKVRLGKLSHLVIVIHAVLSLMRVVAVYKNYSASIQIYEVLNEPSVKFGWSPHLEAQENVNVCVGKEWYRFPSSFFIPESLDSAAKKQEWRFRFVAAGFGGQLPGNFNESLPIPAATRHLDMLFNDLNKEVVARYWPLNKCDFLVDTDSDVDAIRMMSNTKWKTIAQLPFIDAAVSNSRLFRSFYIPYFYEKHVKFTYFKLRVKVA